MSKQSDRSGKAKTKKHMKTSKKNKIIITITVIVLLLVSFGYFAYTTGLPSKILPGAKIVHTVDGKQKTVKRISIAEMVYYYQQAYTQYQGVLSQVEDIDSVYNPTTGQTYRGLLWETAANTAQSEYMLCEAIEKTGFKPLYTDDYVENQVDQLREMVSYVNQIQGSNMTADQYLQNIYGRGMTVQIFRKIMKRQAIINEFEAYVKQTTFLPDQEKIQAKFNEDPYAYTYCRFQVYFVNADIPEGATDEEKQAALDKAMETAKTITDGCVNDVEFQTKVMLVCPDEYRERMLNGEDPTSRSDMTKEQVASFSEEFADMCFDPNTQPNTSMAFYDKDQTGVFAALFQETYLDEENTVAFRVLQLDDDLLKDISKTKEEKAPSHQKLHAQAEGYKSLVTSEDKFIELVKEYSTDSTTAYKGGYYSGIDINNTDLFKAVQVDANSDPEYPEEDKQLMAWLFDPTRKPGDMYIIDCVDSVKLYYFCDSMPAYLESIRVSMIADNFNAWYNASVSDTSYSTIVNDGLIDFFAK